MVMANNLSMGKILSGIVFYFLKRTILKNTGYDVIGNNNPIEKAKLITIPTCLMIGEKDDLVDQEDFKEMFNQLGS